MLARAETHGTLLLLEVALWALPTALAALLLARSNPGVRAGWLVVALACVVICIDKAIDLQMRLMPWLRQLAHLIDPEASNTGSHRGTRIAIVGGAALMTMAGLWLVLRRDRQFDGPKRIAASGLCGIVCYLGARFLLPPGTTSEATDWIVGLCCWGLVMAGLGAALRRGHATAAPDRQ